MIPLGILLCTFCFSKEAVRDSLIITSALFRLWTTPLLRKWSLSSLHAMNHEKHSSKIVFSRIDEKSLIIASALFRLWSSPCASRLDKWVYLDWLTNHHFPRVSGGTYNYIGFHNPLWVKAGWRETMTCPPPKQYGQKSDLAIVMQTGSLVVMSKSCKISWLFVLKSLLLILRPRPCVKHFILTLSWSLSSLFYCVHHHVKSFQTSKRPKRDHKKSLNAAMGDLLMDESDLLVKDLEKLEEIYFVA